MTKAKKCASKGRRQARFRLDHGFALALVLFIVAGAQAAEATNRVRISPRPAPTNATSSSSAKLEEQWGIQVASLRLTAQGSMLDFRYRVLDPDKAAPLANRKFKAYLIDQASGLKFGVPSPPKVGAMRQNTAKLTRDRIYFIMFGNPGQVIRAGSKVTVVIGEFRVENLTVE